MLCGTPTGSQHLVRAHSQRGAANRVDGRLITTRRRVAHSALNFQAYMDRESSKKKGSNWGRGIFSRRRPPLAPGMPPMRPEEATALVHSCMADAASFHWLQERLLPTGDVDRLGFDYRNPMGSYALLFNRLANPAGKEAPQMERALLDLRRDVRVLPGLASRRKRWKLLCLAVSNDWMDPLLEEAFPRLGGALSLVEEIVGPRANCCTHVQLVTFTEWNGSHPKVYAAQRDRIWRLGQACLKSGVRLEVFTWDTSRYGWSPEVDENGTPLLDGRYQQCHWRCDSWGPGSPDR